MGSKIASFTTAAEVGALACTREFALVTLCVRVDLPYLLGCGS